MAVKDLILDVGNSRTKAALFVDGALARNTALSTRESLALQQWLGSDRPTQIVLGSVARPEAELIDQLREMAPVMVVDGSTATPLRMAYQTPTALGVDRLANAVAAASLFPGRPVLVIDAGTCITYDIVGADASYDGGAISPGMVLRAKAMNAYSARLPLVVPGDDPPIWGRSTEESMVSGIHHGIVGELRGFIATLAHERPAMAVVLTGGDGLRFARALKSGIFAHPLLTLQGLYAILEHNRSLDHVVAASGGGAGVGPRATRQR